MTGVQITILSIYAVIVAIWPIRLLVIEIVLRRQRVLSIKLAPLRAVQPAACLGDHSGQG